MADEFGVRGAVDPRPVPHITLFRPYDTDRGSEVKDRLLTVFEGFDIVPYRIDGVGTFPETEVVYVRVVPSPELRELRRSVSRELRPVCEGYQDYDGEYHYEVHVTIGFRDVGSRFDEIRRYVRDQYALQTDAYATRITSLRGRSMLWEYDLPCGEVLNPGTATTADSWQGTERAFDDLSLPDDHDDLSPSPGPSVGRSGTGARGSRASGDRRRAATAGQSATRPAGAGDAPRPARAPSPRSRYTPTIGRQRRHAALSPRARRATRHSRHSGTSRAGQGARPAWRLRCGRRVREFMRRGETGGYAP